jgi:hypothetical protein
MDREETLAFAYELLKWNVPVIVCRPKQGTDDMIPIQSWKNITNAAQCDLSSYRHGTDALALIGGHGIDVIDVDTKADPPGSIEPFGEFACYGVTVTPSGGRHYVVTSTGLKKMKNLTVDGRFVGDYVGGDVGREGRLIAYLPGSHRPNKYGGVQYGIEVPWDVEGAVLAAPDRGVIKTLQRAREQSGAGDGDQGEYVDLSPPRDPIDGVAPKAKMYVDLELQKLDRLAADLPWAPGMHWDDEVYESACTLLRLANSNWTGYTHDDALADLLEHAPRDDRWGEAQHMEKWQSAKESVGIGGRMNPDDPAVDFVDLGPAPVTLSVDVTNPHDAYEWLVRHVGKEGSSLAGMFRRGEDLVHTPRVGEEGYVEPHEDGHEDGPAQVRRMSPVALQAYLANHVRVFRFSGSGANRAQHPTLFPDKPAAMAAAAPEHLRQARPLRGVTHTPLVRADGSVLSEPGYDRATRLLYMPQKGLRVPRRHGGLALIDEVIEGFPFKTEHHRANYVGMMLSPLLRELLGGSLYPMLVVNAHQPGSGKSLLARVLRIVHGGVLRGEVPREAAELEKQITAILDTTSAPVVTFDNVSGTLRSSVLDSLLTTKTWTGRILGAGLMRTFPNDRLWVITGNNVQLGGDMERRVVWVTIDPGMAHPEQRTDFRHLDLPGFVEQNRGEILAALMGLVTDWVEAGRPSAGLTRTDDFGRWQETVGAILRHAGVPGVLNHEESKEKVGLADEEEWGVFLGALHRARGRSKWTVKDVLEAVGLDGGVEEEELPDDVVEKMRRGAAANKTLGWWLKNRADRWAETPTGAQLSVRRAGSTRTGVAAWQVVTPDEELL